MDYSYASYAGVIIFVAGIMLLVFYSLLRKLAHRCFLWVGVLNGYKLADGVLIHPLLIEEYQKLEKHAAAQEEQIRFWQNNPVKTEKSGQLRLEQFVQEARDGHESEVILPLMRPDGLLRYYHLVFRNSLFKMKFLRSEDYMWVVREYSKTGKRDPFFKREWISVEDYDPKTDWNVLEYFPYADKAHTQFINKEDLPFTYWYDDELDNKTASRQLSFEDIQP